ncbi:MAG: hypothetical protein RLZ84_817, partial [Actinomycetota bacterium]
RYSLLDQISHRELFPYALAHNIDISMGGVLNSGVLANPVAGATYNYLPASDEIISRAAKIGEFLKARNIPLLAAALQFPLRHPAVTSVLTGPRTAAELLENVDELKRARHVRRRLATSNGADATFIVQVTGRARCVVASSAPHCSDEHVEPSVLCFDGRLESGDVLGESTLDEVGDV